jgi:Zn-dependent protease
MGLAALAVILVWLAVWFWRVCAGRSPAIVRVFSFSPPEALWQRAEGIAGMDVGADGFCERVEVEHPFALRTWNQPGEDSGRLAPKEFWHQTQVDIRPYGSLMTVTFLGRCSPFFLAGYLFHTLLAGLKTCWFGTLIPQSPPKSSAASVSRPLPQAARRKSPKARIGGFVQEHSREIILSLLACASFTVSYGFKGMLILAPVILLHEYGHLLAYQLTGKTGNKIMLVPFFGGIAVAGSEHKSEFDRAFCAIMGPAICVPVTLLLTALSFWAENDTFWWWCSYGAFLCSSMNALNLLPMLPLDGGHSIESVARSISPSQSSAAMLVLTIAGALLLQASGETQIASIVGFWGIMSVVQSWGMRSHAKPLSAKSGLTIAAFHAATFAVHAGCAAMIWFWAW